MFVFFECVMKVRGKAGFRASVHQAKLQFLAPQGRWKGKLAAQEKKSKQDTRDQRRSPASARARYEHHGARMVRAHVKRSRAHMHARAHTNACAHTPGACVFRQDTHT